MVPQNCIAPTGAAALGNKRITGLEQKERDDTMGQAEEFRGRTRGGVLPNTSVKIEVPRSRNRREGTNDGRRSTLLAFPLECGSGNDVSTFREEIRYKQFVLMWRKAARAVVKEIIA